ESAADQLFVADYALTSSGTFDPLTVQAEQALRGAPGVLVVSGIRAGSARFLGGVRDLTAADPNLSKVVRLDWTAGSDAVPARLGRRGMFTDAAFAKRHD